MMNDLTLRYWEPVFIDYLTVYQEGNNDASHDLGHFRRVFQTAKYIADYEQVPVDHLVVLAAAYFHDIVSLPKNHVDNHKSSSLAAIEARKILQQLNFPEDKIEAVCHAIKTHSFSAGLQPETIEAKLIQDADRMEALGALGAMRTFYVSGRLGRESFDPNDFYAKHRFLDDKLFALDHFYVKLFKLPDLLQTVGGRFLADQRVKFLRCFVEELENNVKQASGGALTVVNACYHAGQKGLSLFDLQDPFALNRSANPTDFVIDHLIELQEQFQPFLGQFLSQFRSEIEIERVLVTSQ